MTIAATWTGTSNVGSSTLVSALDMHVTRMGSAETPGRLTFFGGVTLHAGEHEIVIKHRKAKAMLAYLALAPGMTESRDRLIGLLWSEAPEPQARASLRQLLHAVRGIFDHEGVRGLSVDKTQVSLSPAHFTNELDAILAGIDAGHPPDCLVHQARLAETFLYGYDDVDPAFGHWLRVHRESVRQRLIRALERQLASVSRPVAETKRIAFALLQVDPTHEPACRQLMRVHVETGNAAGALLAYKSLWEHLEQDYDIEPSAATQEFAVAIKRGICPSPSGGWGWRIPVCARSRMDERESGIVVAL